MSPEVTEVDYRGPATIGGSGRARQHDRAGEIGELAWEALGLAGWLGETIGLRTIVFLRIRVGSVPEGRPAARSTIELLPGDQRKRGEKGWIDEDHMAYQGFERPLNGRTAGARLSAARG